jgi:hypothetical protein
VVEGVDEVLIGVGAALEAVGRGDCAVARTQLEELWNRVGVDGDPLHRCAIAHTLADTHDNPEDELVWDERALEAARSVDAERMQLAGMPGSPRGLLPSLHLNLADVLMRLGRLDDAATHIELGEAELDFLPADGYRAMISGGFERIKIAVIEYG